MMCQHANPGMCGRSQVARLLSGVCERNVHLYVVPFLIPSTTLRFLSRGQVCKRNRRRTPWFPDQSRCILVKQFWPSCSYCHLHQTAIRRLNWEYHLLTQFPRLLTQTLSQPRVLLPSSCLSGPLPCPSFSSMLHCGASERGVCPPEIVSGIVRHYKPLL